MKSLISGKDCVNPSNLVEGDPVKTNEFLLSQMNDPLVPVKLRFFEETANKLNNFLVNFQTSSPMVPFIVDSLENLVRSFVERFVSRLMY